MAVINAQSTTFTFNSQTVGGIKSFSGFDGEAADIDVSTLASTRKEFLQGLPEEGNLSLSIVYDPDDAGQAEMLTARNAQTAYTCVLTLPDTVTLNVLTFSAYVKSISIEGSVDDAVMSTVNLKITGAVTQSDSTP